MPRGHKATRPQSCKAQTPHHKATKPQRHEVTRQHDHKATWQQSYKATRPQGHQAIKPQRHKVTRPQGHTKSEAKQRAKDQTETRDKSNTRPQTRPKIRITKQSSLKDDKPTKTKNQITFGRRDVRSTWIGRPADLGQPAGPLETPCLSPKPLPPLLALTPLRSRIGGPRIPPGQPGITCIRKAGQEFFSRFVSFGATFFEVIAKLSFFLRKPG